MVDKVIITKNGIFAQGSTWDEETERHDEWKRRADLSNLRNSCVLEDGLTLGDFFRAVEKHPDIMKFIGDYSWCQTNEFHRAAELPPEKTHDGDPLSRLELSWFLELDSYDGEQSITVCDDLVGVGVADGTRFSISFSPMSELANLPLVLNPVAKLYRWSDGKHDEEFTGIYCPTLLEVLDAVYFDISFYGSPEETKMVFDELRCRVKDIESGEAELIPFEEVKRRLEEKLDLIEFTGSLED